MSVFYLIIVSMIFIELTLSRYLPLTKYSSMGIRGKRKINNILFIFLILSIFPYFYIFSTKINADIFLLFFIFSYIIYLCFCLQNDFSFISKIKNNLFIITPVILFTAFIANMIISSEVNKEIYRFTGFSSEQLPLVEKSVYITVSVICILYGALYLMVIILSSLYVMSCVQLPLMKAYGNNYYVSSIVAIILIFCALIDMVLFLHGDGYDNVIKYVVVQSSYQKNNGFCDNISDENIYLSLSNNNDVSVYGRREDNSEVFLKGVCQHDYFKSDKNGSQESGILKIKNLITLDKFFIVYDSRTSN